MSLHHYLPHDSVVLLLISFTLIHLRLVCVLHLINLSLFANEEQRKDFRSSRTSFRDIRNLPRDEKEQRNTKGIRSGPGCHLTAVMAAVTSTADSSGPWHITAPIPAVMVAMTRLLSNIYSAFSVFLGHSEPLFSLVQFFPSLEFSIA